MAQKDVEMKDTAADEDHQKEGDKQKETDEQQAKKDKDLLAFEEIREQMKLVEKGVAQKEPRFINRAIRNLHSLRRKTNDTVLRAVVMAYYPPGSVERDMLLEYLEEPMETDETSWFRPRSTRNTSGSTILPELDVFLNLLILVKLVDNKNLTRAKECCDALMEKLVSHNRRSMDPLCARSYFYHSRVYELLNQLSSIRNFFHTRLRTATLRHDEESQAMLINLLLRNYLHYNLYDQAGKLESKSTFPESANNSEMAKHMYYIGRIRAIKLDYSDAFRSLTQAIRKAPQHSAVGFKQTAHKFAIVVQLLLGEIPDRATFRDPLLRRALVPYYQLTQAVRTGDLTLFSQVLEQYGTRFQQEKTYTLIVRLHHNVIKAGIRRISLSYSRVALGDIAAKLHLDSAEDAEFIVAKAIRDGVIEASLEHEKSFMQSRENVDIYCTKEPHDAFHQRIMFCLDLYGQSVKAMRYPPKAYKKDLETAEKRREREQQDLELAQEMADDDDEDFP